MVIILIYFFTNVIIVIYILGYVNGLILIIVYFKLLLRLNWPCFYYIITTRSVYFISLPILTLILYLGL
jgi:hypothetical protein